MFEEGVVQNSGRIRPDEDRTWTRLGTEGAFRRGGAGSCGPGGSCPRCSNSSELFEPPISLHDSHLDIGLKNSPTP